jgi:L-threonylcarbamoyladenylate synthase
VNRPSGCARRHPVPHALLAAARRLGVRSLAAPSANRFITRHGALAAVATSSATVPVLDGGACRVGIESSIVDCSGLRPMLLRPGVLTRARIEAAAGEPMLAPDDSAPQAPGTLESHYAPRAKVRLMATGPLHTALQMLGSQPLRLAEYSRTVPSGVAPGLRHRRMPARPEQAAHELFSVLRELDAEGVQLIWVEDPPPGPDWDGVRDRLTRAAAS